MMKKTHHQLHQPDHRGCAVFQVLLPRVKLFGLWKLLPWNPAEGYAKR